MVHMEQHTLSLSGLGRQFGSTRAVDAVNLDIAPGQFVGVIGRSGAGKSTLLRLINRLVVHYLTSPKPTATPRWSQLLLAKPSRVPT